MPWRLLSTFASLLPQQNLAFKHGVPDSEVLPQAQPGLAADSELTRQNSISKFPQEEALSEESTTVIQDDPSTKKTWAGTHIWDSLDKQPEERRLILKLDLVLLTFGGLGYFVKNLDQINVQNAYVSGMKEELGMWGNEFNYAQSMWTVGYTLGQIPSNLILTRVSPAKWIPFCECMWAAFTVSTYGIKNVNQLYALRFFVGLFESSFYPGMVYIMGSWYRKDELGKRAVIFWTCGSLGNMFSGFLQAAAYTNLNGVNGHSGWRWLFLVDAIITFPIALAGFAFMFDMPFRARPGLVLSAHDLELANARMKKEGRAGATKYTWKKVKRIARSWHIWILPWLFIVWNNAGSLMVFWLQNLKYSVRDRNLLPLPITAIQIIGAWAMAWTSDGLLKGRRWPAMLVSSTLNTCLAIALLLVPIHAIKPRFVIYYLTGIFGGQSGLILAWGNEICSSDTEERALVVGAMNDLAYVFQAWVPLFVWKQTEMPAATKGLAMTIGLSVWHVAWVLLVKYLVQRDDRKAINDTAQKSNVASVDSPRKEESDITITKTSHSLLRDTQIPPT